MGGGPDYVEQIVVLRCQGCREGTVVVEEKYVEDRRVRDGGYGAGGRIHFQGLHWWPPADAQLDPSVPQPVADAFLEGIRSLGARCPRAAAVMFRRTLEAVIVDCGSAQAKAATVGKDGSLAGGLRVMAEEGTLNGNLADWAAEIKAVGNAGGHFDPIEDVTADEARSLAGLERELLRYLYEMPARLQRTKTRVQERR